MLADFNYFLEMFTRHGAESVSRFYGPQRAVVERVDDPEERGRIQAHIAHVHPDQRLDEWIDPMFATAGDSRGEFWPPDIGDRIWVLFENGDPDRPIGYIGGWYSDRAPLPSEFAYQKSGDTVSGPVRRGWVTRAGHRLIFDDTVGSERLSLSWHQPSQEDTSRTNRSITSDRDSGLTSTLDFKSNGSIEIVNSAGARVLLDVSGKSIVVEDVNKNKVELNAEGIVLDSPKTVTIKAGTSITLDAPSVLLGGSAGQPVPKGTDLLQQLLQMYQFLVSHFHTSAVAGAPTTPPLPIPSPPPAPTVSLLSTISKTG